MHSDAMHFATCPDRVTWHHFSFASVSLIIMTASFYGQQGCSFFHSISGRVAPQEIDIEENQLK
jgi:hypothetical protein